MVTGSYKKFLRGHWSFIAVVIFFITHAYSENQFLVPLAELLLLTVILLALAMLVFLITRKLLRHAGKAALFTSYAFAVVLFFGVVQEFLEQSRLISTMGRLIFLVPLSLLSIVVFFVWLSRTKHTLKRFTLYLNVVLLIYIIIDLGVIAQGMIARSNKYQSGILSNVACDSCSKPSVYLIVLDSYFGSEGLRRHFNYANAPFENYLRSEGFHINNCSISNYLITVYSMASMLNMDYLEELGPLEYQNHYAYKNAKEAISNNKVLLVFAANGYTIRNISSFEMKEAPAYYRSTLMPDKIRLITKQTMYYRLIKYLPAYIRRQGWMSGEVVEQEHILQMKEMMRHALPDHRVDNNQPTFTYLHLLMPHFPYVYDSAGNSMRKLLKSGIRYTADERFFQYQLYTNKTIAAYISELKKKTFGKAVILLMSDHGYQQLFKKGTSLAFYNLNAIYLPDGNYGAWYEGISNVNQFRLLFNKLFHQQMPLLKDSIVY